jgi:hypothetical protein
MKAWLFGVAALALAASALSPVARADGPRASSENNWSGMTNANPAGGYPGAPPQLSAAPLPGPRPSSENNWPGISDANAEPPTAAQSAPHYVWREGYSHHGRWTGQWVLVR